MPINGLVFFLTLLFSNPLVAADPLPYTLADYAKDCTKAGITLPDNLKCEEGTEVPIKKTICKNGKQKETIEVTSKNYDQYKDLLKSGCDNPSHLMTMPDEVKCLPGSRIQVRTMGDTSCVFFCRRYYLPKPGREKYFQDINMICYQKQTGATCFFNTPAETSNEKPSPTQTAEERYRKLDTDGSLLRTPGSPEDKKWMGLKYFDKGDNRCVRCHDAGPFILTPFLWDLKIVPSRNTRPSRDLFGPYQVVGSRPPFTDAVWKNREELVNDQANECTKCHRIGPEGSCNFLLEASVSEDPRKVVSFNRDCPELKPQWMPPSKHALRPSDLSAIAFIRRCCANRAAIRNYKKLSADDQREQPEPQSDPGCTWKPIPAGENAASTTGTETKHPHAPASTLNNEPVH